MPQKSIDKHCKHKFLQKFKKQILNIKFKNTEIYSIVKSETKY